MKTTEVNRNVGSMKMGSHWGCALPAACIQQKAEFSHAAGSETRTYNVKRYSLILNLFFRLVQNYLLTPKATRSILLTFTSTDENTHRQRTSRLANRIRTCCLPMRSQCLSNQSSMGARSGLLSVTSVIATCIKN